MFNPGVVYMLTCSVLFATAVVVHFHTTHMSLPISSAITFLAVVLPIAAFLNAYVYPNLLRVSHTFTAGTSLERLAPVLFQGLQAVVTAIMATLLLEGIVPSPALDFLIEYEWGKLYAARDEARMQVIQDTYNCCGLNDVDDRAVPIVSIPGGSCAELFGRTMSCRGPWQAAMQVTSAVDFGVVVVVGLMQIIGLLIMRERTAWWTALRTEDWKPSDVDSNDGDASRPLFTVPEESEDSSGGPTPSGYGSTSRQEPETRD